MEMQYNAIVPEKMKNKFIEIMDNYGDVKNNYHYEIKEREILAISKDSQKCSFRLESSFIPEYEMRFSDESGACCSVTKNMAQYTPWVVGVLADKDGKYECCLSLERVGIQHLMTGTFYEANLS